jgi:hypothetical protein
LAVDVWTAHEPVFNHFPVQHLLFLPYPLPRPKISELLLEALFKQSTSKAEELQFSGVAIVKVPDK